MVNNKTLSCMLSATLCVALLPLAGCDKTNAPDQAATPDAASAPVKPAYVPPTAEQLYQMVGPIALFPDKLVAQVLAGSTYPDQITAADNWLAQNRGLKGVPLQNAANQQPWDVSVKGLTMFPDVLDQMAKNIQWTSALGEVYVNDPTDVMNAIQVMRQRASNSGNLKTNRHLRIAVRPRVNRAPPPEGYVLEPGEPPVYSGPEVIPEPPQMIVIEPYEPDVVYVPTYDPGVVYGESLPVYPGYSYAPPRPEYGTGEMVTDGVISFGLGIAVGAVISNHDWGWNSWGVHWGGDRGRDERERGRDDGGRRGDAGRDGGWHRPAVVYNNSTYVSRSTTIVNRVTNNYNINNSINTRNTTNNNFAAGRNNGAPTNAGPVVPPGGVANGNNAARPNFAPQNPQTAGVTPGARPGGAPAAGQPNFNNMNRPHVGRNGVGGSAGTPPVATPPNFNNMTRPNFSHVAPGAGINQQHPGVPPGGVANGNNAARPNFAPQNPQTAGVTPGARPGGAPAAGQPNFNNMNRPHVGRNGVGGSAGTPPVATPPNFNNMTRPNFSHVAPGAGANQQHPGINQTNPAEMARQHPNQGQHPENNLQNRPLSGAQPRPEMTRPPHNSGAPGSAHPPQRPQMQAQERPQPPQRPPVQSQERLQPPQRPPVQAQERSQPPQRPPVQAQERSQPPQRPPLQAQERPQPPQRPPVQPQERPQPPPPQPPQPPQPQPHPPAQAPQNHPQPHDDGGHPHPDKKDQTKHE